MSKSSLSQDTADLQFDDERSRAHGFAGCWQGVDISCAGLTAMILGLVAMVLDATALGSTYWAYASADSTSVFSVQMGVFQWCQNGQCNNYFDNSFTPSMQRNLNLRTRTEATAAFTILALIFTFVAMVLVVFGLGRTGYSLAISRASAVMFTAGFFGLIAVIIFGSTVDGLPSRFNANYSIALAIVAFFFDFIASGLLLVDSRNITYHNVGDAVRRGGAGMI